MTTPEPEIVASAQPAAAAAPAGSGWDPAGLAGPLLRLANELFATSPAAGGLPTIGVVPAPPLAVQQTLPQELLPAQQPPAQQPASPLDAAAVPRDPFGAAPRFDALEAFIGPVFTVPLLDLDGGGSALEAPTAPAVAPSQPTGAAEDFNSAQRSGAPFIYSAQPSGAPFIYSAQRSGAPFIDPHAVRREFPILAERVNGRRLVWLDNAATTQKPQEVIDRLTYFYEHENSNVHRAAHTLAARATDAYESARATVRQFLNASSKHEIVFVRGATEGINLVAQSWGRRYVQAGDEIVITWLEHHANIVPWQQLCSERGARLRVAPVDDRGQIILEEYDKLLGPRTRLVSLTQVSNALGTITPAHEMVRLAHRHGARVLVDGAQAVSHMQVDVQLLDCDFYVFSGHKVFAPTGIGVVYGKGSIFDEMPPWQGGGNMIQDVTFERTRYEHAPARFEAGTGNIADAAGLGAALDWLMRLGRDTVSRYEHTLLEYATERLATVPGLRMIGTAAEKAGVLSFVLAGQKTEEIGGLLDQEGIAVRSGHHCAQPILRRFGLESTVRASLAPYNTVEDIDALVTALLRLQAGRGQIL